MGLFRRKPVAAPEPEERATNMAQAWAQTMAGRGLITASGVSVSLDSALRNAAVWACRRQLAATVVALPIDVIRTTGNKRTPLASADHPQIIRRPDVRMSRRAWIGQVISSALMDGNAYGDILEVDGQGRPTQISTIWPEHVSWINGVAHVDGKARDVWPLGNLWHMPVSFLLQPGSRVAMSPVKYGSEAIGTSLAAEKFGADFFSAGGMPVTMITVDQPKPPQELLESLKEQYVISTHSRRPFAKGKAVEVQNGPEVNVKDSQFIDLMRFEVEQACRIFGMPPSLVYAAVSGQNVTYANVTQSDLHYLKHTVAAWLTDLEDCLTEFVANKLQVKFNTDAVLRMDAAARTQIHVQRLQAKTRTVNEVRILEDEEPFTDPIYDEPGIPGDAGQNVVGITDVVAPTA